MIVQLRAYCPKYHLSARPRLRHSRSALAAGEESSSATSSEGEDRQAVNLKELSRLLGLSQTTISRALNGYPEVNEETRQRVLKVAKETGYRPNR
eukprot:gene51493-70109_t